MPLIPVVAAHLGLPLSLPCMLQPLGTKADELRLAFVKQAFLAASSPRQTQR